MHRRIRPAVVPLVLAMVLAACGGSETDTIEQTPAQGSAPSVAGAPGQQPVETRTDGPLPPRRDVPNALTTSGVPWQPWAWEPPPPDEQPAGIWIPVIDVWAATGGLGLDAGGEMEVPQDYGATGWYMNGPRPGESGPSVVAGHVDSRDGPAVFFRLRQLAPEDLVHVVYESGFVESFRVTAVERHGKNAFPTGRVYGDTPGPQIRLITCGGDFDRGSGHYRENVVAYGEVFASWRYDPETGQV